jgi:hydroxyacylglutathione hydrolase
MVTAQALRQRLAEGESAWLLDIRSAEELASGRIEGAQVLPIKQLQGRENEVPRDVPVYVFCGSGTRATIAASWLQRQGWQNLHVVLGGFWAWDEG